MFGTSVLQRLLSLALCFGSSQKSGARIFAVVDASIQWEEKRSVSCGSAIIEVYLESGTHLLSQRRHFPKAYRLARSFGVASLKEPARRLQCLPLVHNRGTRNSISFRCTARSLRTGENGPAKPPVKAFVVRLLAGRNNTLSEGPAVFLDKQYLTDSPRLDTLFPHRPTVHVQRMDAHVCYQAWRLDGTAVRLPSVIMRRPLLIPNTIHNPA